MSDSLISSTILEEFQQICDNHYSMLTTRLFVIDASILWKVGDRTRVLGTHLGAKEKMLALLFGSPCAMSVRNIAESIEYKNLTQFRDTVLKPAHKADLIHFDIKKDTVELSPIGARHVETNISAFV